MTYANMTEHARRGCPLFAFEKPGREIWSLDDDHTAGSWSAIVAKARSFASGSGCETLTFGIVDRVDRKRLGMDYALSVVGDIVDDMACQAEEIAGTDAAEYWPEVRPDHRIELADRIAPIIDDIVERSRELYGISSTLDLVVEDLDELKMPGVFAKRERRRSPVAAQNPRGTIFTWSDDPECWPCDAVHSSTTWEGLVDSIMSAVDSEDVVESDRLDAVYIAVAEEVRALSLDTKSVASSAFDHAMEDLADNAYQLIGEASESFVEPSRVVRDIVVGRLDELLGWVVDSLHPRYHLHSDTRVEVSDISKDKPLLSLEAEPGSMGG